MGEESIFYLVARTVWSLETEMPSQESGTIAPPSQVLELTVNEEVAETLASVTGVRPLRSLSTTASAAQAASSPTPSALSPGQLVAESMELSPRSPSPDSLIGVKVEPPSPTSEVMYDPPPRDGLPPEVCEKLPQSLKQKAQRRHAVFGWGRPARVWERVRHAEASFYLSPDGEDWRCCGCRPGDGLGWVKSSIHNVGLTERHPAPKCPGCGEDVLSLRKINKCIGCRVTLLDNQKKIENGDVFAVREEEQQHNRLDSNIYSL